MCFQTPGADAFSNSAATGPQLQSVLKMKPQRGTRRLFSFFVLFLITPNILFSFLSATDLWAEGFRETILVTSWYLSLVKNAHSKTNTKHVGLIHPTPTCITLYLLTLHFAYKVFHSVSQCCRVCLQLSAVSVHFCDLKITVTKLFHLIVCLIFQIICEHWTACYRHSKHLKDFFPSLLLRSR